MAYRAVTMTGDRFQYRVEAYTLRAQELYPGETVFNKTQLARISGKSRGTLYNDQRRYNFRSSKISIKEFVRMELL